MRQEHSKSLTGLIHTFAADPLAESNTAKVTEIEKKPKKRSRAGTGKRYRCTHDRCERSYSRAEHLQRHQLNHDPKEIFLCGHPGCGLSFVRKDLRDRHKKRHSQQPSKGTSLSPTRLLEQIREDNNGSESDDSSASSGSDENGGMYSANPDEMAAQVDLAARGVKRSSITEHDSSRYHGMRSQAQALSEEVPGSEDFRGNIESAKAFVPVALSPNTIPTAHYPSHNLAAPFLVSSRNPSTMPFDPLKDVRPSLVRHHSVADTPFHATSTPHRTSLDFQSTTTQALSGSIAADNLSGNIFPPQTMDFAYQSSMLDDQPFGFSPSAGTDEFTSWLFDQNASIYNGGSHEESGLPNLHQPNIFGQIYPNYFSTSEVDMPFESPLHQPLVPNQSDEAVSAGNQSVLWTWKRQALLDIMRQRFNGSGSSGLRDRDIKHQIFEGNLEADDHVLSVASLHLYVESYWKNFHGQFPILHQPTFVPDYVHDYLLLAVIVVGASMVESKAHDPDFVQKSARLANFIAWSLRWQVFTDPESCPPAKLWVLQTLAILEVHEKMNSTRALHERAHVHFAATLTLMRRGSALVGESTPAASRGEPANIDDNGEEFHSFISPNMPEKWWSRWIAQEATRRAAFGAFLLDAMHAQMFGHQATMVIHEIQLPLPCDDTLWSAPSSSEVGRIEFSLYTNGIKPITFLNGLKRTLSCRRVRTNPFGRIILMAGLLSVSWHMHQRDLYGKSLEKHNLGVPEGWKTQIVKALEWWKKDFDESLAHMRNSGIDVQRTGYTQQHIQTTDELAFVLYHLGHITLHVSMPDLCVLAGAKFSLGHVVTSSDRERVLVKMRAWATTAAARHAVYYGVRFVSAILLSDALPRWTASQEPNLRQIESMRFCNYSASNDSLLPRPWVLYYCTLVVWAYGFLLDGPCRPFPTFLQIDLTHGDQQGYDESLRECEHDAKMFLVSMCRYDTPEALVQMLTGRNRLVGLISLVSKALEGSRWELLGEARDRLREVTESLKPGILP